jgi:arginine utilization protein RocB
MSNDSTQTANNQQMIDYIKNSSGEKSAQEFRLMQLNSAKYFETLSNASFFSAIFFGILSIIIPNKNNASKPQ